MNSKMNPARVDREDERRMLPCRNFLDGFCPRGSRCRFYHPLPSSLPTVIRVPNLPSSFQQNGGFGQFPVHTGPHSVFSLSPTHSSRSHLALSPKLANVLGSPVSSRFLAGMNGLNYGHHHHHHGRSSVAHPPLSPTYSEYEMAYAQQMEIQKEKERRAAQMPVAAEVAEEAVQNTVFSHIDWKEFLTPGARPPPPTHVPYMSQSPKTGDPLESLERLIRTAGNGKMSPPTPISTATAMTTGPPQSTTLPRGTYFAEQHTDGSTTKEMEMDLELTSSAPMEGGDMGQHNQALQLQQQQQHLLPKKLSGPPNPNAKEFTQGQGRLNKDQARIMSAKEELQMKVKQIAKELAAEPAQQVQSLDTFFRNYTFQSMPTAPSSEQDLVGTTSSSSADIAITSSCSREKDVDLHQVEVDGDGQEDLGFEMKTLASTGGGGAFSNSESGSNSDFCSSSGDSASSVESKPDADVEKEAGEADATSLEIE